MMESRTALEHLELLRSDAAFESNDHTTENDPAVCSDGLDAQILEAKQVVDSDPALQVELSRRHAWDGRLHAAMHAVPVPADLEQRILDGLGNAEAAVDPSITEVAVLSQSPALPSNTSDSVAQHLLTRQRRKQQWALLSTACLVLTAVLGWWFLQPPERWTVAAVVNVAPFEARELKQLPEFQGEFAATLPTGGWLDDRRVVFDETFRGQPLAEDEETHEVAIREFRFADPDRAYEGVGRGVLLVIPAGRIEDLPSARQFLADVYVSSQSRPRVTAHAWQEDGFVFIALVPVEKVRLLERALSVDAV